MDEQTVAAASDPTVWPASWLHPLLGTTGSRAAPAPQDYMVALQHVAFTIGADPAWRAWWQRSGLTGCELGIVAEGRLDHLRPSADIRRTDDRLRANFTSALPADSGRVDLVPRAAAELIGMFEVIREAIGLAPLPPLPVMPPLPVGAPAVEVTTKPLPSVPREPDQQGYLTLAQIQEFFG
jgi:hypothetical protein